MNKFSIPFSYCISFDVILLVGNILSRGVMKTYDVAIFNEERDNLKHFRNKSQFCTLRKKYLKTYL